MRNKSKATHEVLAFSRSGLTVIASLVAAPVIANDRINQARDEHVRRARTARVHDYRPGSADMPQAA